MTQLAEKLFQEQAERREKQSVYAATQNILTLVLIFSIFPLMTGGFTFSLLIVIGLIALGFGICGMIADWLWGRRSASAAAHRRAVIAFKICSALMMLYMGFASFWAIILYLPAGSASSVYLLIFAPLLITMAIVCLFARQLTVVVFSHLVDSETPRWARAAASLTGLPAIGAAVGLVLARTLSADAGRLVMILLFMLLGYMLVFFGILLSYQVLIMLRYRPIESAP